MWWHKHCAAALLAAAALGLAGCGVQPLYGNASVPYDSSHLFIAIDIGHFGDRATMRAAASAAAERIRAGARAPGVARLFTPGEPEWVKREGAAGQLMLPSAVAGTLLRLAKELRVPADALAPAVKYERT